MQLKRLHLKEYKLFKDFTYEFPANNQHNIHVLIGINGSGKSTILEAIAEIFSCVVLGEKAKFGFELEYVIRYEGESRKYLTDLSWSQIDFINVLLSAQKDEKPVFKVEMPSGIILNSLKEINSYNNLTRYRPNLPSNIYKILPDSIIIYYSGLSEIMKSIVVPHLKRFSKNLRNNKENEPLILYNHEPNLFNLILFCLLSFEFGDVPVFLKKKAKIGKVHRIEFVISKPKWSKETFENYWGAKGKIKDFLELVFSNDKKPIKSSNGLSGPTVKIEVTGYKITIDQKALFNIRDYFIDEQNFFKILYLLYLDGFLGKIGFTFERTEGSKKIIFSILSEGEQQAITIKGFTELLGGENTLFLFDEPDTFLHPQWQRNFISEIEQNVELNHQNELCYLIATHSPQILSNAHPDITSVRIIEEGQLVQQTPKHYGREISSILYNLMGVEERNEVIKKRLSELFMLIEDEEIEEAESLLSELTELLGDTDADIQNATLQLNYLKDEKD